MSKKHLYPTPFWAWSGWDTIKWWFALALLAGIIYLIWLLETGQDVLSLFPDWVRSVDLFLKTGI